MEERCLGKKVEKGKESAKMRSADGVPIMRVFSGAGTIY
jgi:hypothetical protein